MSTNHNHLQAQADTLTAKIRSLLNADLKAICKEERLQVSGVKATLQQRVIELIYGAVKSGDHARLASIRDRIDRRVAGATSSSSPAAQHLQPHGQHSSHPTLNGLANRPSGHTRPRPKFRPSPFYQIQANALSSYVELPLVASVRHTVEIQMKLDAATIGRIAATPSLRIMAYCAVDLGVEQYAVDIAFPQQLELKINNEAFQGSLRGIKKKPGTTRPADITDLVRKLESYVNKITLAYASTDKRYCLGIELVRKLSVEELVELIRRSRYISKAVVLREMAAKANDEDIVATSTVMSLKCPLSTMRMNLPCRSTICTHNQCFDAVSFLQIQEQAPQWSCPVCNKTIPYEALAIDQYVEDIIKSVPSSVEQVTIQPDGTWSQGSKTESFRRPTNGVKRKMSESLDLDDDVQPPNRWAQHSVARAENSNLQAASGPSSLFSSISREPSRSNSHVPPPQSKKASEVIDLTADSEDEEPVRRPIKRQSTASFSSAAAVQPDKVPPSLRPPHLMNVGGPSSRFPATFGSPTTPGSAYMTTNHYSNGYIPWTR